MKMLLPGRRQLADGLILLILSVAAVYGCPYNLERRVQNCLVTFKSYYNIVATTDTALFTGIDVENLRNICVQFQHAYICIEDIKNRCPQNRQAQILKAYGETVNLTKLCRRRNLYEDYAMTQTCFMRAHSQTTPCYNIFRTATRSLLVGVKETHLPSIIQYCSHIQTLGGCIETKVLDCGRTAASLSQDLVNATVPLSQYCDEDSIIIHPLTTPVTGRTRSEQHQQRGNGGSGTLSLAPLLVLLDVVLVLVLR